MDKPILPQHAYLMQAMRSFIARYPDYARCNRRRLAKAYDMALSGYVHALGHGHYAVRSQSGNGSYRVTIYGVDEPRCECPDRARVVYCKHILAALFASQADTARWVDLEREIEREREQEEAQCTPLDIR